MQARYLPWGSPLSIDASIDETPYLIFLLSTQKRELNSQKRKLIMSNSRKASTPATKKAAVPTKKAAPVRRALPAGARVQRSVTPVQTIGDLVSKELMAKQISSATTVTAKRVTGERVTISPLTAGIGLEPATNFDPSSISISQAAKAA